MQYAVWKLAEEGCQKRGAKGGEIETPKASRGRGDGMGCLPRQPD